MKMRRFFMFAGCCLLGLTLASCGDKDSKEESETEKQEEAALTFEEKTVNCYMLTSTAKEEVKIYLSEEKEGIPYIDVTEIPRLLKIFSNDDYSKATYTVSNEGDIWKIERESSNGSYVKIDFKKNTIYCNNRSKFGRSSELPYGLDVTSKNTNFYDANNNKIENQIKFFSRSGRSNEIDSYGFSVDLDDYDINLIHTGDLYLIPLATFYDLFGLQSADLAYNGKELFCTAGAPDNTTKNENGKTTRDLYYENADATRSEELIQYNYHELCLNMDYSYGLKESHGITDFDSYFEAAGIKDLLLSKNKKDTDTAYYMLQTTLLADCHSAYTVQMPYEGYVENEATEIVGSIPLDGSFYYRNMMTTNLTMARMTYNNISSSGTVNTAYQENGDTAIINFDHFLMQYDTGFYYTDEFLNNKENYINSDTVALVSYAQDRISSNPAIKRVIIDLSGNGGGSADSAVFVLGWLDSGIVNIVDAIDGGRSTILYASDVNFDKTIDEKDLLSTYVSDVYCVTSGYSFSCGNLVPCMLKQTGMAKLIGTTSGGGACSVKFSGLADGTILSLSSRQKLCTTKNGSYYDIDQGATPDYYLSDAATLYGGTTVGGVDSGDRANLVSYIKGLEGIA